MNKFYDAEISKNETFLERKTFLSSAFFCEQHSFTSPTHTLLPLCIRFTRYASLRSRVRRKQANVIYFVDNSPARPSQASSKVSVAKALRKFIRCLSIPCKTPVSSFITNVFLLPLDLRSKPNHNHVTVERPRNINFIHIPAHFFVSVKYCKSKYHDFFYYLNCDGNRKMKHSPHTLPLRSFLPKEFVTANNGKYNENDSVVNPRPKTHLSSCWDRLIFRVTSKGERASMMKLFTEMISFVISVTGSFKDEIDKHPSRWALGRRWWRCELWRCLLKLLLREDCWMTFDCSTASTRFNDVTWLSGQSSKASYDCLTLRISNEERLSPSMSLTLKFQPGQFMQTALTRILNKSISSASSFKCLNWSSPAFQSPGHTERNEKNVLSDSLFNLFPCFSYKSFILRFPFSSESCSDSD